MFSGNQDFNEPYSIYSYVALTTATFLCFSMTTSQSLLPLVFLERGFSPQQVGIAMSVTAVPVLLFGLICGLFITKYGPLRGILLGSFLALIAHLSFDLLPQEEYSLYLSRFLHGTALGFLLPAAFVLAKAMLTGPKQVVNFGVFISAVPVAHAIGPPLGSYYLSRYGPEGYFIFTAIPGVIGLALFLVLNLRYAKYDAKYEVVFGYFKVLRQREICLPTYGLVIPALLWGYILSYISLSLTENSLSISLFFTALTPSLVLGRVILLPLLARVRNEHSIFGAVAAMSLALVSLATIQSLVAMLAAAILFGAAYSVTYPILSMWIANTVQAPLKSQAVAMTNTIFNTFTFATPLICGIFLNFIGILSFQLFFAAVLTGLAFLVFLVLPGVFERKP